MLWQGVMRERGSESGSPSLALFSECISRGTLWESRQVLFLCGRGIYHTGEWREKKVELLFFEQLCGSNSVSYPLNQETPPSQGMETEGRLDWRHQPPFLSLGLSLVAKV